MKRFCLIFTLAFFAGFLLTGCSSDELLKDLSQLDLTENSIFEEPTPPAEIETERVAENYYYTQLPESSRQLYRQMAAALSEYKARFPISTASVEEAHSVYQAVLYDYPEYFWVDGESSVWDLNHGESYELEPAYNIETAEIAGAAGQIAAAYNEFYSSIPPESDTYGRVRAAYEWIILHTDYDINSDSNQNIRSVLQNHRSVCAGYAKTFQYFMKKMQIPCIYVPGTADNGTVRDAHAWNLVFIDGQYYAVDATWGDPAYLGQEEQGADRESILYDYLCITTEEIQRSHTPTEEYTYPVCADGQYDFYRRFSNYFERYDQAVISQTFIDTINAGENKTYLKFASSEDFAAAKAAVEDGSVTEEAARQKMEWDGLSEYRYSYSFNDNLYIIKIYW